ncbi:M28 family metallopeptidase [Mucilaginibacter sp. BT774]|uniref:M28 family metallopeptidase n=1 Tax=Mucilaginibacter sp. BT774 TaxID=3062276 RepID=UPI002676EE02|nr:M20/M25/M40 family metallo-hydrolase [Mucilaginibacter sp. BT774]MDO3626707.1 M20/M25/M40 family metallo-hydrolase [Mucilaginibacter sp. BT774]
MKKYLIIAVLAVIGFKSGAQNIANLKKDMYGIASDATQGRFTASAGYLKAARYVEAQLRATGIKPGWKEAGKRTYLQPVPFSWDDYSGSKMRIGGKIYLHSAENFIVVQRGIAKEGRWVVLSPGDSVKGKPVGIILLPSQSQASNWETTVIRQYRFGYMHYLPDGTSTSDAMPTIVVSPALAKMLTRGDSVNVKLIYVSECKTGYNVIGIVPGTDGKPAHQGIIVGAHLDHIGRIGKHIYNGANDDASGCVAELGAARMLATHPGKRAVIFAFFCGEELNLKGSRWFADHLPIPQRAISMTINLEQLGSKHRSFNGVWALGDPTFKAAFYKARTDFTTKGLQFSPTDSVREVLSNTDTYSFMKKKIPSLLLGSGGFDEHHTPQDKINLIDFEHLQKVTDLLYHFIKTI